MPTVLTSQHYRVLRWINEHQGGTASWMARDLHVGAAGSAIITDLVKAKAITRVEDQTGRKPMRITDRGARMLAIRANT